jgi:HSP20 family protein
MVLGSLFTPSRYASRYASDPFVSMRALQRSLDDAFANLPSHFTEAASMPIRLDVKEDDKAYTVTADLPGLSEKEIDMTFDDGVLTIRGEKKVERDEKSGTWHLVERSQGSFARQLSLPTDVQADKIEAKFDKGVLTVILPKETEAQKSAKKISIKTS